MFQVSRVIVFAIFCGVLFVQPAILYVSLCEKFGAILALLIIATIAETIYFAHPECSLRDVMLSRWLLLRILILVSPSAFQFVSPLSLDKAEIRNLAPQSELFTQVKNVASEDLSSGVSKQFLASDYRIEVCCVPLQEWNKARQESLATIPDDYDDYDDYIDSDIDSASTASGSAYRTESSAESSLGIIFASHYGEVIASVVDGDKVALTAILLMHNNITHANKGETSDALTAPHGVTITPAAYSWSFSERRYFHYQIIRKTISGIRFFNYSPYSQRSSPLIIKHSFGLFGPLAAYVLRLAGDI